MALKRVCDCCSALSDLTTSDKLPAGWSLLKLERTPTPGDASGGRTVIVSSLELCPDCGEITADQVGPLLTRIYELRTRPSIPVES